MKNEKLILESLNAILTLVLTPERYNQLTPETREWVSEVPAKIRKALSKSKPA